VSNPKKTNGLLSNFLTQIDMTRRDFDLPFFLENLKGFFDSPSPKTLTSHPFPPFSSTPKPCVNSQGLLVG
jgi:hypothetical protein